MTETSPYNCAVSVPDWQPIETAPKDGQHVLLTVADDPPPYVCEGYFDEGERKWFKANTDWGDYFDGSLHSVTHWLPLPTPPTGAET
jgi:hypothetical protein